MTPYYFIYNVGDPSLIGLFLATTLGSMIIAVWLVPVLSERFGKTGAIRLGAYLTIFSCIGFFTLLRQTQSFRYLSGALLSR